MDFTEGSLTPLHLTRHYTIPQSCSALPTVPLFRSLACAPLPITIPARTLPYSRVLFVPAALTLRMRSRYTLNPISPMSTSVVLCFRQLGLHTRVRKPLEMQVCSPPNTCTRPTLLTSTTLFPSAGSLCHLPSQTPTVPGICGCLVHTLRGLQAFVRPAPWVTLFLCPSSIWMASFSIVLDAQFGPLLALGAWYPLLCSRYQAKANIFSGIFCSSHMLPTPIGTRQVPQTARVKEERGGW